MLIDLKVGQMILFCKIEQALVAFASQNKKTDVRQDSLGISLVTSEGFPSDVVPLASLNSSHASRV